MTRTYRLFMGLLVLIMGPLSSLKAQDTSNTIGHVSIASPTAASLGKFGDIPVSYNTGIPNIGIPIYTVQSGSLKLPIGLSYHASGLKVQENAGWVGAGWALNAGGVITRTVIGAADDRGISGYNNCTNGHYSDYGYNSYQFITGSGLGDVNGLQSDDQAFETGVKDGEPDLYFFNFGSYSGKFYFNDDRTPILVPEQDFKITPDVNNAMGGLGFQGFTVTTPDGVKYYFGKTGNNGSVTPVEITIPSTLQNGPNTSNEAVSSWFLNKIVSADGVDSITLFYTAEKYSYYTVSMFPVTNVQSGQTFLNPSNVGYNMVKNFVQGVRLSGISFPNGTVTFTRALSPRTDLSDYVSQAFTDVANTESYALGSIQVSDSKGFCKKDSLYYGYFYDANAFTLNSATYGGFNIHSDQYRLRLDSLQESSCDASVRIPPYKFSYFTELVPRKLSFGIDHWGFSNGNTSNQTLIPAYTLIDATGAITQLSGASRDPAWPDMRGGALQQITYPTGGFTRLAFEPHNTYVQYTSYSNVNVLSGSVGFGGTTQTAGTFYTDATSSAYVVNLSSAQTATGGANLILTDASGNTVQNWAVASNSSATYTFVPPSNTAYTWTYYSHVTGTASFSILERLATSVAGNTIVGGLRIDTLTNNDGVTVTNNVTTYTYTNGGTQSSGILYSRPVYVQTIRNDVMGLVYGPVGGSVNGCVAPDLGDPQGHGGTYYMSGGSITPMSTVQGSHIGYNQVQVTQNNNGYSIYRYYGSNTWDNLLSDVCTRIINTTHCPTTIPNFPAPPLPYEYSRGELKYEGHFNQAGQALKDAAYTYNYAVDPIQTPGIAYITIPGLYSYTGYTLQSAKKVQTKVVSTAYDPSTANAVTTTNTTYYGSNFHHQPTRNVVTTSTGDSLVTNTKYVMDFRIASCDAVPDSLPYYNTAVHADSVQLYANIGTCTPAQLWVCRYDTLQAFRQNINRDRKQYITYRRRSYSDSGNLVSACYLTAENAADALLKPVLRLQDEYNNAPLEVSEWKDLNLRHASFTQYDTSTSPLGFAYPGRSQTLFLRAPAAFFTNAAVSGSTITKDSRYLDEAVFKFSDGNPQQVTAHDGVTSSYLWDYKNTQPIAKAVNAPAGQIAYTSFEADGAGNWTLGSAGRDTTNGFTGTKSYVLNSDITRTGLTSTTTYIVSYWTRNTSPFTITGTISGYPVKGKTILYNNTSWTLYTHRVTGQTTITLSGSGPIDELRLYPLGAQMTTYTYTPLVGMTSQTDMGNRVTYYEYDGLQRLKRIRDQDHNILKSLEYQYQASSGCGPNCYSITMQTLAGTNTLGYPVGVFDVHGKLLGNATGPVQYVSLWNADTADARIGTLSTGADSLHFSMTLNNGMTLPTGVTGCRYYQFDLAWNNIDAIRNNNGVYVDFGDGYGMRLGNKMLDTPAIIAPNTIYYSGSTNYENVGVPGTFFKHTYSDNSLKTLTFYHNDGAEVEDFDNTFGSTTSLTLMKNLRGNLPQNTTTLGGSSYQQSTMTSVANIANWNGISTVQYFRLNDGDTHTPAMHIGYAQDFMKNNKGLKSILTSGGGYYLAGCRDTAFKISRLKSDWNTYFTNLEVLGISDEHWNREDLSTLTHLTYFTLVAGTQDHTNNINPPVPIPASVLDSVINQVAAGAGRFVSNGVISLITGGTTITNASSAAVALLQAKGWTININW